MKVPNVEIEQRIRKTALDLLMDKEPEEIGMREIARSCGITPPTIYYYFADKDQLFTRVKSDCLEQMDAKIVSGLRRGTSPEAGMRYGLEAFRDWAFDNPRIAVLIMGRFKPDSVEDEDVARSRYYYSMNLAVSLLEEAISAKQISCADPVLAGALCVYSLWGVIESVLSKRTFPKYWTRGKELTDASIRMCLDYLGFKGEVS